MRRSESNLSKRKHFIEEGMYAFAYTTEWNEDFEIEIFATLFNKNCDFIGFTLFLLYLRRLFQYVL